MSKLFSSFKMRGLELDNRIVLSPMCQYAAENGNASSWHTVHLGTYALGGLGLLITEATAVEPEGRISPWCLGLYSDENQAALERIIRFCREYGNVKFGVQLAHAGRKSSVLPSFMVRRPVGLEEGGWKPLAPSKYEDAIHPHPVVMDKALIERVKNSWVDSTRRAAEIGVDLVELHFAHGYLVHQFLSPLVNQRTDTYGGSLENRMRLGLEIFELCRDAWPHDRPMGVRISATDWVTGGWDLADSVVLANELRSRGCDYICVTSGGATLAQKIETKPLYQVPFADEVRRKSGIVTMAVGQITRPDEAEQVLESGSADLVAIGRKLLANPRWAWDAAASMAVFLKYPPRYRVCHPRMGSDLNFTDTPEKRKKLIDMFQAESGVPAQTSSGS